MEMEVVTLIKDKMWTIVPQQLTSGVFGCIWLFTENCNVHEAPTRFKARLVA